MRMDNFIIIIEYCGLPYVCHFIKYSNTNYGALLHLVYFLQTQLYIIIESEVNSVPRQQRKKKKYTGDI